MNFEALANEHKDAVYRQMLRVCGNREDAEDVLVEALLKAYRHLEQLRELQSFRGWLAQIARRVCWRLKEREALLPLMQLSELEEEGREIPSSEAPAEQREALREMKELLRAAMAKLPEEYRAVYEKRDVEGLAGEVVAKELGISPAAMKSRLHRARGLVRDELDQALLGTNARREQMESRSGAAQ
jgi:RNA polymerase sigma-70 factor (ECF subfamily)